MLLQEKNLMGILLKVLLVATLIQKLLQFRGIVDLKENIELVIELEICLHGNNKMGNSTLSLMNQPSSIGDSLTFAGLPSNS